MKATRNVKVYITLELDVNEAKCLMDMMQNPVFSSETEADGKVRADVFNCLRSRLDLGISNSNPDDDIPF